MTSSSAKLSTTASTLRISGARLDRTGASLNISLQYATRKRSTIAPICTPQVAVGEDLASFVDCTLTFAGSPADREGGDLMATITSYGATVGPIQVATLTPGAPLSLC